jgi:site-specific recombinase XerD
VTTGARKASAPRLIELFLDMLASERGGAANTLAAYGAISTISPRF